MFLNVMRPYYSMIEIMMILLDFEIPDHINANNMDEESFYKEIHLDLEKKYGIIIPYEELFQCLKIAKQEQTWEIASLAKFAKFKKELNKFYLTKKQKQMIDRFLEKTKWEKLDS